MAQAELTAEHVQDRPSLTEESGRLRSLTLTVENMNCGGCMRKVEKALMTAPGVASARAHLSAKRVAVGFDETCTDPEKLITALGSAGYTAAELVADTSDIDKKRNRDFLARVGVAGFAAANVMLLSVSVWASGSDGMEPATRSLFHWISALIALPAVAYAGQPFFRSATHLYIKFKSLCCIYREAFLWESFIILINFLPALFLSTPVILTSCLKKEISLGASLSSSMKYSSSLWVAIAIPITLPFASQFTGIIMPLMSIIAAHSYPVIRYCKDFAWCNCCANNTTS